MQSAIDRKYFIKSLAATIFSSLCINQIAEPLAPSQPLEDALQDIVVYASTKARLGHEMLVIIGEYQKMFLIGAQTPFFLARTYTVSTGKNGFGNVPHTGKTPTGLLRIKEKIGTGAPLGTIFKGRRNTGEIATVIKEPYDTPDDLVTTRILWLDGQEQKNKNAHSRYIYIHGTPEEGLLGKPVSNGCIRMSNKDIIELYARVKSGTYVYIKERL